MKVEADNPTTTPCSACGMLIPETGKFCPECGAAQNREPNAIQKDESSAAAPRWLELSSSAFEGSNVGSAEVHTSSKSDNQSALPNGTPRNASGQTWLLKYYPPDAEVVRGVEWVAKHKRLLGIAAVVIVLTCIVLFHGHTDQVNTKPSTESQVAAPDESAVSHLQEQGNIVALEGTRTDFATLYAKVYGSGLEIGKRYVVAARINDDLTALDPPFSLSSTSIDGDHDFDESTQLEAVIKQAVNTPYNKALVCNVVVSMGYNHRLLFHRAEYCFFTGMPTYRSN